MNDLEMMNNPMAWPMFPLLPLKNTKRHENGMPAFAVLIASSGKYDLTHCGIDSTREEIAAAKVEGNVTVAEVIADGWIVD